MSRPRKNSLVEARQAFIKEIRVRRAYLDMKQKDLSEIIGISSARMSELLSKPDTLTIERLRMIIEILSLDPVIVLKFLGYDQKAIKSALDNSGD